MNLQHWLLGIFWMGYCVIHSLLADARVKLFFEKFLGSFFRYYRLAYTILAAVILLFILYFQYSLISPVLINMKTFKYVLLVVLVIPGLIIMIISIYKYFRLLSGVRTIYDAKPSNELKLEGIHHYVRHPLYLGTLLLIWGLFFIFPMLNNLIAVMIITGYVLIGSRLEEKKLLVEFGSLYENYILRVPALIPGLRRLKKNKKGPPYSSP